MDLIDCINYKRKQLEAQKIADEILRKDLVAKTRDFFRKLDEGDYEIKYSDIFTDDTDKLDKIYIKIYEHFEKKRFKKKKTYKTVSIFYWDRHLRDISCWSLEKVETFHYNLATILQKIGEQYGCK